VSGKPQQVDGQEVPLVSIVVPARNEERWIGRCLDGLLAQDWPAARLEVVVVVGTSRDRTRALVAQAASRYPQVRLVDNPHGTTPRAMNLGIRAATGDLLARVDAHTVIPADFVSAGVHHPNVIRFHAREMLSHGRPRNLDRLILPLNRDRILGHHRNSAGGRLRAPCRRRRDARSPRSGTRRR